MDVQKMNPITLRIYDINGSSTITSYFYDKCVTSGHDVRKADEIVNVVAAKFAEDSIPWAHAVGLSVHNTNSTIGGNNSFTSRCKEKKYLSAAALIIWYTKKVI